MKMITTKTNWLASLSVVALALASLNAQAQVSPTIVPAWDFTISGNARGVAQMIFNIDGSIEGQLQMQTRKNFNNTDSNPRGSVSGDDRNGGSDDTPASTSVTNFIGSATVNGQWGFDPSGKIIGFLNQESEIISGTSTNRITNAVTHSISFRGSVRDGSLPRFTFKGSSPLGSQIYQGIPLQPLPNISGAYIATGRRGSNRVVEFFTLSPFGINSYLVDGSSSGLTYSGEALLSGRKQLSMVTASTGTNEFVLTGVFGSFKTNTLTGALSGKASGNPVSLKVFPQFPE
jgi:hypothetical protein